MRFLLAIEMVCGFLSWSPIARTQEPNPPVATENPAGLRVMFNGNSWFIFVPWGVADQVKAAEIAGHKEVKMAKPNDFSAIEAGEVDVYAHGVHWWMEVPWGKDGVFAEKIVAMGLKANPKFRAYYHAAWLVGDGRAKEIKTTADYDSSKLADVQAALDRTRKPVEAIVDKLNEKFGKKVVFLVPVGDATVKLRAMVLDGKYPGVNKQSELWSDAMPHAGGACLGPERLLPFRGDLPHFAGRFEDLPMERVDQRATRDSPEDRVGDGFKVSVFWHHKVIVASPPIVVQWG